MINKHHIDLVVSIAIEYDKTIVDTLRLVINEESRIKYDKSFDLHQSFFYLALGRVQEYYRRNY